MLLFVVISIISEQTKKSPGTNPLNINARVSTLNGKIIPPSSGCYTGMARWKVEFDATLLDGFNSLVGKKALLAMFFSHWADAYDQNFNAAGCAAIDARGAVPVVSWMPMSDAGGVDQPDYSNAAIVSGKYDAYINKYVQDIKAYDKPIFLRFAFEMNADWFPYGGNVNGNDAGPSYVAMWRYVHDKFTAAGVTNVTWVWAPYVDSLWPGWPNLLNFYPGDAYVDWVGADGYGWGPGDWSYESNKTYTLCFQSTYDKLVTLNKPIMWAEIAAAESKRYKTFKPSWITDAFNQMKTNHTKIKAFTWFDYNKEKDWRVNSSSAALSAYKNSVADPYFIGAN